MGRLTLFAVVAMMPLLGLVHMPYPPTLSRPVAIEVIKRHFPQLACTLDIHSIDQYKNWAGVWAGCHNNPDSVINAFERFANGQWTMVCGHGDDEPGRDFATHTCHMPLDVAAHFHLAK